MRVYQHPNGQKQMIDCDQEFVWVHPKAKKVDFGWSLVKDRLYSAKAKLVEIILDPPKSGVPIPKDTSLNTTISDLAGRVMREGTAAVEENAQVIYDRGYRDAIKKCYCPGATIEMASRVQAEARRLGL